MFFDIGWPEFLLIGVVALVVIGPKDLPAALRVAGYWVRKARTLSREFHSSVEQMMREVELHEVQNELRKATEINLDHEFNKIVSDEPPATPRDVPDYLDTSPAPAIAEGGEAVPGAGEPAAAPPAEEEPELPLPMPMPAAAAEPEPVRAEPPKP
ncbi:MAG TPA: Sec-independent protein translocase protein TatB [Stellaceae bacterium]|nr:Sec-independent protein translocase protein TatB [Stellaceae bacterium]